jgi:hypothetical protein
MAHRLTKPGATLLLLSLLLTACTGAVPPKQPADQPAKPPASTATPKPADYHNEYPDLWKISDDGPAIPQLSTGLVPQGLAYWKEKNWLIIANYQEKGPSSLTVVDAGTGAEVKTVQLSQENGDAYTGHAGGAAVSQKYLWLGSESKVYYMPLSSVAETPNNGKLTFAGRFQTETKSSFITYAEGILWAGDFYYYPDNDTAASHKLKHPTESVTYNAWAAAYRLDPKTDLLPPASGKAVPDYVLAITDRIQGMAVTPNSVILSQSYGRTKQSTLFRHKLPDLNGKPDQTVTVGGKTVPLWFMDRASQGENLPKLTAPSMSEGVVSDGGNKLYVLFESGAKSYRSGALDPMDHLRVIRLNEWEKGSGK